MKAAKQRVHWFNCVSTAAAAGQGSASLFSPAPSQQPLADASRLSTCCVQSRRKYRTRWNQSVFMRWDLNIYSPQQTVEDMQQSQRWDGSSEHQENVGLYTIKTVISSHFLDNFDKFQLKFIHIALSYSITRPHSGWESTSVYVWFHLLQTTRSLLPCLYCERDIKNTWNSHTLVNRSNQYWQR